jgi:lipopolysaccharide transport system ATP-binding protein
MSTAVLCENLSKIYPLYANKLDRVKEALHPLRRKYHKEFYALKDINLRIESGETIGIIGRNGSGKSTLLKILSGVTIPTKGSAEVTGRIASLLELGAGFHPELTGLENVFLHGLLRGRSRAQTKQVLDSIQDFAGIGPYISQPVKAYSSGMFVRLAFAAELHTLPELFIVDEALSVGDAHFQVKCLSKMRELAASGTTIVFVSHDASIVRGLCRRAILLDAGSIAAEGSPSSVYDVYSGMIGLPDQAAPPRAEFSARSGSGGLQFASVTILDARGNERSAFHSGEHAVLHLRVTASITAENPTVGFSIRDRFGQDIFGTNTALLGLPIDDLHPGEALDFSFALPLNLGAGVYEICASIHQTETHVGSCYDWINGAAYVTIEPDPAYRFSGTNRIPVSVTVSR